MSNRVWEIKKISCNIVAWMLIWIIAVLAVPVGLIMLVIYCLRSLFDKIIKKMDHSGKMVEKRL